MLLRLAYLTATNTIAALRLLPMGDRNKDVEILALRHQITVLERQLGADRVKFAPEDRAFLAALLAPPASPPLAPAATTGAPGYRPALAPRPDVSTSRAHLPTQAARTPTHRPLHTRPRPTPGQGEPQLGVQPGARRTRHPRHQGRPLHRLGDPQDRRHRPRAPARLQVHHEVLDGLRHPARGRVRGGSEDVLALPGQGDGLDEVAGEQCFGLGAQEAGPGCAGRGLPGALPGSIVPRKRSVRAATPMVRRHHSCRLASNWQARLRAAVTSGMSMVTT